MMSAFVVVVVGGYALAAGLAAPRGLRPLWLTAAAAGVIAMAAAVLLGLSYDVRDLMFLLGCAAAFTGPVILVPTTLLSIGRSNAPTRVSPFLTAFLGACAGLACSFIVVVYGLKAW